MTRTGDQLARRALEVLNVVPIGVSPSAVNHQYCLDNWEELAQQLRVKELYADNDDEIPLEVFQPLSYMLAAVCAPRFGKKPPGTDWAYEELRVAISEDDSGENIELEYF